MKKIDLFNLITNLLRILREIVLKLDERVTKLEAKSGDNQ
jgi:hypothetical protein